MPDTNLQLRNSPHALAEELAPGHYRLAISDGLADVYRLAQLDDFSGQNRRQFGWKVPCRMEVQARLSLKDLPGTWGFGFWNDPFTASLGLRGMARRLPALPNAAWFFYASPPNYLSLRDDTPAQGFLAAAFSSPVISTLLLSPGLLAAPLLAWRPAARLVRRLARILVKDDAVTIRTDFTQWHTYRLDLTQKAVCFSVDDVLLAESRYIPQSPLGRVLWIDNQYAAFTPDGRLKSGALANPPASMEIKISE